MEMDLDLLELSPLRPNGPMPLVTPEEVALTAKVGPFPPLLVRPLADSQPQRYEILRGEKTWRLAQMAGLGAAPVVVRDDIADDDARRLLKEEGASPRSGDNPLMQARDILRFTEEGDFSLTEAARMLGFTVDGASHRLRLLRLDPAVQELVAAGQLRLGHAKPLVGLPRETQRALAHQAVRECLSARALERLARTIRAGGRVAGAVAGSPNANSSSSEKDADLVRLEAEVSAIVGSPVTIEHHDAGNGTLSIGYANLEILQGLLERMGYRGES